MSMTAGGSGDVESDVNITPLVDVVLVLLIICRVATPILQMGLDVEVPPKVEVTGPPPESELTKLVVNLRADGIYLNNTRMATPTALRDALAPQMISRPPADRVVFINAEDQLAFAGAVVALDAAHVAGPARGGV